MRYLKKKKKKNGEKREREMGSCGGRKAKHFFKSDKFRKSEYKFPVFFVFFWGCFPGYLCSRGGKKQQNSEKKIKKKEEKGGEIVDIEYTLV